MRCRAHVGTQFLLLDIEMLLGKKLKAHIHAHKGHEDERMARKIENENEQIKRIVIRERNTLLCFLVGFEEKQFFFISQSHFRLPGKTKVQSAIEVQPKWEIN